jgi:hypothetical protein
MDPEPIAMHFEPISPRASMAHPFADADEIYRGEMASRLDERERLIHEALRTLEESGCRPDPFFDRLFLDEMLSNAVLHGNREDPAKRVRLRAFRRGERWGVEVADEGPGFDWKAALRALAGPLDPARPTNRGLQLILAAGAELHFLDGGSRIIMVRRGGPIGK